MQNCSDAIVLPEITSALSDMRHTKKLAIRCFGKNLPSGGLTRYCVMENDHDCPVFGVKNMTIFNINVKPNEVIEVTGRKFPGVVVNCLGGLCDFATPITVQWPSGEKLGTATHHEIINAYSKEKDVPVMKLENVFNENEKRFDVNVEVRQKKNSRVIAKISGKTKQSVVTVEYLSNSIVPVDKILIMMAAFKCFHTLYNFNQRPIPIGLPSMMSVGKPEPPSLFNHLKRSDAFIMRPACTIHNSHRFMELLQDVKHRVVLIVETSEDGISKMFFKDVFGNTQFSGKINYMTSTLEMFSFDNEKIGDFRDGRYYSPNNSRAIFYEKKPEDGYPVYEIKDTIDSRNVAEVSAIDANDTLRFHYTKEESIPLKALLLGNAVRIAATHFKIHQSCVPTLENYPFRPC